MKTVTNLDRTDRRILNALQHNGRIANVDLARAVNLTPTPCLERVKRLEREGFITRYVALLDPVKANAALCAYIEVQLTSTTTEAISQFNQQMMDLVFTVGQYNLVSMALNSFGVQPDADLPGWDI